MYQLDKEELYFKDTKDLVITEGYASPALLQRKLKIDYNRAATLMELLEEADIIEPADGAKPRRIKLEYKKAPFPFNFT